jgi:hypothetical protein
MEATKGKAKIVSQTAACGILRRPEQGKEMK